MKVKLETENWVQSGSTLAKGAAYKNNALLHNTKLAELVDSANNFDEILKTLESLNGFFAIVSDTGNKIVVINDHVGSYPLYYGIEESETVVSDTSTSILREIDETKPNMCNLIEYLSSGLVTGNKTIYDNIYQLQSGEVILIDKKSGNVENKARHYIYNPTCPNSIKGKEDAKLMDELDEVLNGIFKRLIEYAGRRPIIMGLSGGYDSRLILLKLHQLGYNNIYTYTHDTPSGSSYDINVAKSLTEHLDINHAIVNHTHSDYKSFRNSAEWDDFLNIDGFIARYPTIHQYVTQTKLQDKFEDLGNAVHISGMHPLGLSGISRSYLDTNEISKEKIIEKLSDKYFSECDLNNTTVSKDMLAENLLSQVPLNTYDNTQSEPTSVALSTLETIYWQERVGKSSSAQNWPDHFGFERWYPLIDKEYYNWLSKLDISHRIDKDIHKKYIQRLNEEVLGENKINIGYRGGNSIWEYLVRLVLSLPDPLYNKIRKAYKNTRISYKKDPRYGIVPQEFFKSVKSINPTYKSVLVLELINSGKIPTDRDYAEIVHL